ncbi:MAG TPA: SDR family oxidoreductase [Roseiflexaceae bacterium]|nr:SDR family oxidoreductase [Roseiflexaceae bacterium]HMP42711.1 SDR family oxidoreductase [Roseiflexaceae bacterium]
MRLHGKIALITGAGAGIGRGIAQRFAAEGARVGVFDTTADACSDTVAAIEASGGSALALVGDVSQAADVDAAVAQLATHYGPPDTLIHNAAVMPAGTIERTAESDWDRVFAVNCRGAYLTSRAMLPHMRRLGRGSITFMASVTGMLGLPGIAAYSATKGALIALARAMSTDHAREGIRVNAVSPGTIDSPMLHAFLAAQREPERLRREFNSMHPIGRVGRIDEVVNVFVFLASDDASFVTGANYTVDGGLSVKGEQPQDAA